jgi:outer membrane protein
MAQGGTASPSAPPTLPTRIGVVSNQRAIVGTNDGQKGLQVLENKFDPEKNELKSPGDEIDSLKTQLETQGPKLNDEARASLGRQIDTKPKTLSRAQEDAQNDFTERQTEQQNEVVPRVLQKLIAIIDKYAQDNRLILVMDDSKPWPERPIRWASPSVDITKAVVDIYNAHSVGLEPRSNGRAGKFDRRKHHKIFLQHGKARNLRSRICR